MKARYLLALSVALGAMAAVSSAHTVWVEPISGMPGDFRVTFGGHAGKIEPYQPQKLKSVDAFDSQGKQLPVKRSVDSNGVRLHVDGSPGMIAMHFDNGIHTRTDAGPSIEKPMNEVPGATRATNAIKYGKAIVAWSALVTRPLEQPFEVIPLDASQPVSGQPLRVRVVQEGKPVAGVKLGRGEEGGANDPVTDAQGIAAFVPTKGCNKLWAGKRTQIANNPKYTELSYEYLLSFTAD